LIAACLSVGTPAFNAVNALAPPAAVTMRLMFLRLHQT